MANMIPPQIDNDRVSASERRIFGLLDADPAAEDWTVLHSLGVARRETGPFGEIDFVVIIPGHGIICLEVKGGRVSCVDGIWRTMDRYGNVAVLRRSPFMQARESMFALRNSIVAHFGQLAGESKCPIGTGVVFPDVNCPPITPEFQRADVIDAKDLRRPISKAIERLVDTRLAEFQRQPSGSLPTLSQVKALKDFLRPNFDLVLSRSATLGQVEAKLLSLTEEQYARLDELEANARCLFEGAAGTGKTLLCVEYARRAAKSGAEVLLVCFNRLLGEWLKQQTSDSKITAGTWHEITRGFILGSSVANEFLEQETEALRSGNTGHLFGELYPFYGTIAMEEEGPVFDVLAVDEMQDLGSREGLDFLNLCIRGGLAGGRWAMFGDFTRQALYRKATEPASILAEYCDHFVRARLTLNCRNSRRIAEETSIVAGFDAPPFRSDGVAGPPVEHRYWKTSADLADALTKVIEELLNDGTNIENVMVLSPRRLSNSALRSVRGIARFPLVDVSRNLNVQQPSLKYSTIHSYKGLESQAVIVVDIDEVDGDEHQALLYVGMSRARGLLVLMINERARPSMTLRIRRGLEQEISR